MTLLVIQRHVGTLLGIPVGIESVFLADAKMRHISAVLPNDVSPWIVQTKLAVLDAKLPAAAHGLVVVLDAKGLAFSDANVVGLASAGTDGVVDAFEASVLNWGNPVCVGRYFVGLAFVLVGVGTKAATGSRSFLGADAIGRCKDDRRRSQEGGQHEGEFHFGDGTLRSVAYELIDFFSIQCEDTSPALHLA